MKSNLVRSFRTVVLLVLLVLLPHLGLANPLGSCDQHFRESFDYPKRLASDSLAATAASATAMLTTVQLLRTLADDSGQAVLFDKAFLMTVPADVALTLITHVISLGHIPILKKLLTGEAFGKKLEFVGRAGTNAVIGTAVIIDTWLLSGVDASAPHLVCAAAGLCVAVYPVLLASKRLLFQWLPTVLDRWVSRESRGFLEWEDIEERAVTTARELGVGETQARAMVLSFYEKLVTSLPIEDRLSDDLRDHVLLRDHLEQQPDENASFENLSLWRRNLIDAMLKITDDDRIAEVLKLSERHGDAFTLKFHQALSRRYHAYRSRIIAASVLDQSLSVGVAGGVFMYGINEWAATGVPPWFLFDLLLR